MMRLRPLLLLVLPILASSCSPEPPEAFALYLARDSLQAFDETDLAQVELADEPLLGDQDLIAYERDSHTLRLAPEAARRLENMDLPGQVFVLTVGGEPLYGGAFMAAYFSRTYDGVVILWPPMGGDGTRLHLQLGYPGPDDFAGADPRDDPRLTEALRRAGKLE